MRKTASRADRLTKTVADKATKGAERYTVWDTHLTGFGLRVSPTGVKTYIARYRVGGGRRGVLRQQVIGRHGTLTADEARDEAKVILADAARGLDPQRAKTDQREELTVAELCDLYMGDEAKGEPGGVGDKKLSTRAVDRFRIDRHIKPLIGSLKLSHVDRAALERFKHDIAGGRVGDAAHPLTKGGKAAATRTLGLLGAIFGFAIGRKLMTTNPAKGVKRFKQEKRERFLSPKELGALGDALAEMEAKGWDKAPLTIVRLLALTGCRKNEIVNLTWGEIDREHALLRLADSKTGAKLVRLGAPALAILEARANNGSAYVFPDPRDGKKPFHALNHQWSIIRRSAGLPGVRLHDLRHSFASFGLAGGAGLPLIGKLLGHADMASTQRYAHLADDPLRAAADSIASGIAGAMGGRSADIVPIKGAK